MALRRGLPFALAVLVLGSGGAQALDERAAARVVLAPSEPGAPPCIGIAPWGPPADGVSVVVVPNDRQELSVALMRDGADGQPVIVAGPASFDPITLGPLWACRLDVATQAPLGGRSVIGLRVANSYTSTGRSTTTEALHLLIVDGTTLRPVFGSIVSARHAEGPLDGRRTGWTRRYQVVRSPAPPVAMPEITVRDARTGRVVSRHRWRDDHYQPPAFDRFPPVGPG